MLVCNDINLLRFVCISKCLVMYSLFPVGILGLTVLAIGNSVGDWVADTAVARAGKPGMGIASCFGSPLLNDVIGLSVALIVSFILFRAISYMSCTQTQLHMLHRNSNENIMQ